MILVDVWEEAVRAINNDGLHLQDKQGEVQTVRVRAATDPSEVGPVDLVLVLVKAYDTEVAVRNALPMVGADTVVLTLQNGWGSAPRIAGVVGEEKVLVGVTYNSATVLGPGRVQHTARGPPSLASSQGNSRLGSPESLRPSMRPGLRPLRRPACFRKFGRNLP